MVSAQVERGLDHPSAAAAAYELRGLDSWPEVVAAVCALLRLLVPHDSIVWQAVDSRSGTVVLAGDRLSIEGRDPAELLLSLRDHPISNHFFGSCDGRAAFPARLSDFVSEREFHRTQTWAELFEPLDARRHVTLLTSTDAPLTKASGWALNRWSSDFTDDELAVLTALRPLLTTLERDHRGDAGRAEPVEPALTARETEVLQLVAQGLTAVAISRRLGISAHTVRRHLEHVYAKSGCHDRLLAVGWAVERGLIRPGIG